LVPLQKISKDLDRFPNSETRRVKMPTRLKFIPKPKMMRDEVASIRVRIPNHKKRFWRRKDSYSGVGLPPIKKVYNGGPKKRRSN
jgi:hypothetical protein